MIRLKNGSHIIGFDDGYQLGKTANFVFNNGVHMLGSVEPTLKENSLFYDGEFFKVGEGRAAITEDKLSDDTARIRTMAGIAMELRKEGLHKAEAVLAVGLPFSNYGRDKLKLADYYSRQGNMDFTYEGEGYSVTIGKVIVCPQCYSAVASRLGNMKGDYLIVDIGSKTTDVVYVQDGIPIESRSITIEKAMVKWMKEIQHDMKVQTGKEIPEYEIMKTVLKKDSTLPAAYTGLIRGMRIERETVPKGRYQYEVAGDDDSGGDPARVQKGVLANFFGTLICDRPLPVGKDGILWLDDNDFEWL